MRHGNTNKPMVLRGRGGRVLCLDYSNIKEAHAALPTWSVCSKWNITSTQARQMSLKWGSSLMKPSHLTSQYCATYALDIHVTGPYLIRIGILLISITQWIQCRRHFSLTVNLLNAHARMLIMTSKVYSPFPHFHFHGSSIWEGRKLCALFPCDAWSAWRER